MENINLLLNGKDNVSIKKGDTKTTLDFSLIGKDNKGMPLTPSLIEKATFVIRDTRREAEPITVLGDHIKVDGKVSLQLTDEFYATLGDKTEFALELHITFKEGETATRNGIYPMNGYFSLTLMDSLL